MKNIVKVIEVRTVASVKGASRIAMRVTGYDVMLYPSRYDLDSKGRICKIYCEFFTTPQPMYCWVNLTLKSKVELEYSSNLAERVIKISAMKLGVRTELKYKIAEMQSIYDFHMWEAHGHKTKAVEARLIARQAAKDAKKAREMLAKLK